MVPQAAERLDPESLVARMIAEPEANPTAQDTPWSFLDGGVYVVAKRIGERDPRQRFRPVMNSLVGLSSV